MWYPLLADLKEKGMKNSLIATFLYNRAIKIPLIPITIYYFGIKLTIILTIYMIIFSIINGILVGKSLTLKKMKIAIASEGKNEDSEISLKGGRAPYYLIYEDKSLTGFIESGQEWLRPMLQFRNWLASIRDNREYRMKRRTGGSIYFSTIIFDEAKIQFIIPKKTKKRKISD